MSPLSEPGQPGSPQILQSLPWALKDLEGQLLSWAPCLGLKLGEMKEEGRVRATARKGFTVERKRVFLEHSPLGGERRFQAHVEDKCSALTSLNRKAFRKMRDLATAVQAGTLVREGRTPEFSPLSIDALGFATFVRFWAAGTSQGPCVWL